MPGARCARSLVCEMKRAHKHSHHGHTGNTRHSPRNGFNGFLRALPGEPGFLATVIPKKLASQELDISVGISGPHDFAVRKIGALVSRTACVHRIPPHVRDDRETPLCRDGMDWLYCCFYQAAKRKFF
jgi:hypothetical protein